MRFYDYTCQMSCLPVLWETSPITSLPYPTFPAKDSIQNSPHTLWWFIIHCRVLLFDTFMFVCLISPTKCQGPWGQGNLHIFLISLQKKISLQRKKKKLSVKNKYKNLTELRTQCCLCEVVGSISGLTQWAKYPGLPCLWCRPAADPWPGNFHMPQAWL